MLVEGYGSGGFKFEGRRVEGSTFVNAAGYWPLDVSTLEDLSGPDISQAIERSGSNPEMVLIGTGAQMQLLPKALREYLEAEAIGYDVMDTGAAARTFNVLRLEDRPVAALLLAVS